MIDAKFELEWEGTFWRKSTKEQTENEREICSPAVVVSNWGRTCITSLKVLRGRSQDLLDVHSLQRMALEHEVTSRRTLSGSSLEAVQATTSCIAATLDPASAGGRICFANDWPRRVWTPNNTRHQHELCQEQSQLGGACWLHWAGTRVIDWD